MRRLVAIIGASVMAGAALAMAAGPTNGARSAPGAADATNHASTLPIDPFQAQLQERLQSPDPAVREAAQRELAAIAAFWRQPDMLEQMSDATDDPALKALFRQRMTSLRMEALENQPVALPDPLHLPPISLKLQDASFADMTDALNTALGGHYLVSALNLGGGIRIMNGVAQIGPAAAGASVPVTADIKEKPLWEAVRDLEAQQRFIFLGSTPDMALRLVPVGSEMLQGPQVSGPAMLFAGQVSYRRTVNLQVDGPAAHVAALTIPLTLVIDPRVMVSSFGMIAISKITDETGQTLAEANGPPASQNFVAQSNIRTQQTTMDVRVVPGKRLNVTCDTRITAATESITSTIEDVENSANKAVALGPRLLRVAQARISPDRQLTMQIIASPPVAPPGVAAERVDARIQYKLLDAEGKVVWSMASAGTTSLTTSVASATGPFKLTMTSAGKTQEIPLHFELKDIALP